MVEAKINLYLNILLIVLFIIVGISSKILFFGTNDFIISKTLWKTLHNYVGLIFIVAMFIHIIFHWEWLKAMLKLKQKA